MDNFANRLKEARLAKGMTEQELADKLHVTRQAVSKWENGINYPDVTLLTKIAKLLDVDLEYLLDGETKQPEVRFVEKPMFYKRAYKSKQDMIYAVKIFLAHGKAMRIVAPIFLVGALALAITVICLNVTRTAINDLETLTVTLSVLSALYAVMAIGFGVGGRYLVKKYGAALRELQTTDTTV